MRANQVCLLNPPTSLENYCVNFPMGLVSVATALRAEAIPVEILDFDLKNREKAPWRHDLQAFKVAMIEELAGKNADVFGITSMCSNFPVAILMAEEIRRYRPQAKIVLGGPQASMVSEETLRKFPFIDAVVIGEGERTFLELLRSDWSAGAMAGISGLAFREGEEVRRSPPRALVDRLDELPFPDFSLVDLPSYLRITSIVPVVEAGRGCPFTCSFCSTAPMWSRKFRIKSPERILAEMRKVAECSGLKTFDLIHDNFTTSARYLEEFCDYFSGHNRDGFVWGSSARIDTLKKGELAHFKEAGCEGLFFGIDSGSPKIQEAIDKHLDLEYFKEVLQETIGRGMRCHVSMILGFPEESREDIDQTVSLGFWAKSVSPRVHVSFHRLSPLAGSPIFSRHKASLYLQRESTDLSYAIFQDAEIWDLIERHPMLFSSYYTIPTPHLESLDLFEFARHYSELIKEELGLSFAWLMKKKNLKPTTVYESWIREDGYAKPGRFADYSPTLEKFCDYL